MIPTPHPARRTSAPGVALVRQAPAPAFLAPATPDAAALVALWLAGRRATTKAAYAQDVAAFARWMGLSDWEAVAELLAHGAPAASALVLRYRAELLEAGKSPATVARRLSGLRSLVNLARLVGAVSWALEVEAPQVTTYRDTRGPGADGLRAMLGSAERATVEAEAAALEAGADGQTILKNRGVREARRDRAVLRLLADCALRRSEVVGLDVADIDLRTGTAAVLGKGRSAREPMTLPTRTREALGSYLETHPTGEGPLFPGDGATGRLTGRTVARIVGRAAIAGDLERRVRPHGVRHAAITHALDVTGGDVRRVAKFSRHRDLRTLTVYDDARRDLAGEVAALVSEAW